MAFIEAVDLVKEFHIKEKKGGLRGAISSFVFPNKKLVKAVDGVSFNISEGEIVGYLGPNGSGKSTTIKMLTGILNPTSGTVKICGISPHKDRMAVVKNLGVVFGQRSQLYWDLRLGETFELLKRIYKINDKLYKANLDIMDEVLGIYKIINTPVRQLSLGQRMRGDLAAATLHSPPILFLDEPTIGLDIEAKLAIRNFIYEINRLHKTTIILTTHDLSDVEHLCKRLVIINNGKVIEDDKLNSLVSKLAPYRMLIVDSEEQIKEDLSIVNADIVKREKHRIWVRFANEKISASEIITFLSNNIRISDLSIKEPNIEDVIKEVYSIEVK